MANYTTKTASLKAIKADIRKVNATAVEAADVTADGIQVDELKVKIVDETTEEVSYPNIVDLIQTAQETATEAAGITVGRDLNGDYKNTGVGEVLDSKIKKMNFYGAYVNVVEGEDGEINLYFGENKNPAEYNEVSSLTGTAKYVYSGDYSLTGLTAGNRHSYCNTGGTVTIRANDSATNDILTIPNKTTTIKVVAYDGSTELASAETAAIDGNAKTVTAKSAVVEGKAALAEAVTINVTDIVENLPADASKGLTPGFIRCKISATIDNAKLLPNGGTYKVKMTVGNTEKTAANTVFVYKAASATPSIDAVSATYTSKGTRTVSGLTYDSGATINLEVTGIKNTQWMATTNTDRITISDDDNRLEDIGNLKVENLTAANGTSKTAANAEFSYTTSKTVSLSHEISKFDVTYTVTPLHPLGGTNGAAKTKSVAGENYLWNGDQTADASNKAHFRMDSSRLPYAVLTDDDNGNVTGLTITEDTYNSSTSIADGGAYAQQALVQGEYLKHPDQDDTDRYTASNCTGYRYWTKLISTGTGTGAQTQYKISCPNGGLTKQGVKLWAVCANTDTVATAGAKSTRINALGADGGCAKSVSDTLITIEIPGGQMTCTPAKAFYLVIQIPAATPDAKIGAITVEEVTA